MIGLYKGDNAKGIEDVKDYLTHLGFLNSFDFTKVQNDDFFYDSFKVALRRYQRFYNLNITGTLDAKTIAKMQEPRCGMPDIYNTTSNYYRYKKLPLIINDSHMRYTFFPGRPKWPRRNLTYTFNKNVNREFIRGIEHAIRKWESVTKFKFFNVKKLNKANIRISFMHGRHGDGLPFGGPNPKGGIAHGFSPPDGRVHFDPAQSWSTNGDGNAFDVQTIGLHELGHVLGLGHSDVPQAAMYAVVGHGERKTLHEDDIKGIKALYGWH